jgi:preprotein translocase subunit SecY
VILTTGTLLLMWLGEQITERGIGNGVSLIITVGILARMPLALQSFKGMFFPPEGTMRQYNWTHAVMLILLLCVVIAGVILVTQGQRKIPVQYAQRAVGRKVYSGGTSFMPLRVNYAGVMPVIFAQAILMFLGLLLAKIGEVGKLQVFQELGAMFGRESGLVYLLMYSLMILFFSYFWVATQFNELQVADDLKKHGGYIPGVRPGSATSDFLHKTMSRVTLAGAVSLALIAIVPILLNRIMKVDYNVASFFGGTSLLISVGVLLDTMRMMESHLLMRHYDGFLQKGKVRGRS